MRFKSRRVGKKTSLFTVHVMKSYGRAEVQLRPLLITALDGGEWFDAAAALPRKMSSLYYQTAGCDDCIKRVCDTFLMYMYMCFILDRENHLDLRLSSASNIMDITTGSNI